MAKNKLVFIKENQHLTIFLLAFLSDKYLKFKGGKLYAAFIELKGTVDSVLRDLLWKKN